MPRPRTLRLVAALVALVLAPGFVLRDRAAAQGVRPAPAAGATPPVPEGMPLFTVAQDGSARFIGRDERPILAAVAAAQKAGGGVIHIAPGTYEIADGIRLRDVRNVHFVGPASAVLKLAPLVYGIAGENVPRGAETIRLRRGRGLRAGQTLRILADGEIHPFTKQPTNYFLAAIAEVEADLVRLTEPLKFPVPADTPMTPADGPNLFDVRGASELIHIAGLTLDGGRTPDDPPIPMHAQRCGVFVEGKYSYDKGPLEPPVADVAVQNCAIRNCFGRGVAFYSADFALVEECTIEAVLDEAIDFDHFCRLGTARDNRIADCRVGVELNDARECVVEGNEISRCTTGLNLWRFCKQPGLNEKIVVARNRFHEIAGSAIVVGDRTAHGVFEENDVRDCGRAGIVVRGADHRVLGNIVEGTGRQGITVDGTRIEVRRNRMSDVSRDDPGRYPALTVEGPDNVDAENETARQK